MTNNETLRQHEHIKDTLEHKRFLIDSCLKMIDYLYEVGRYDDALALAKRCSVHDHSKFTNAELLNFVQLPKEEKKRPCQELSDEQKKLLEIHWSRNRHHPEFHKSYHEMSEIDILEMVCDWHARSCQFGNSLVEYARNKQKDRFGFDDEFFEKVLNYCQVLENSI